MVGCVIVNNGKIIGEGFHKKFGDAHAEVNAINSVREKELLKESVLYVNLEPCSHFGKTPPCSDFILKHHIPKVVIGCTDSNEKVSGKGIEKLKQNGVEVITGVMEKESRELNRRFFTFHEKKRPYIILKWAQTQDGYIAKQVNGKGQKTKISGLNSQILSHQWRSEEHAIMVGTNTAEADNPWLDVRHWNGENPVRIVIDRNLRLSKKLHLFDGSQPTLVITKLKRNSEKNLKFLQPASNDFSIPQILSLLHRNGIQSVIVEGGSQLFNSFFSSATWDEIRRFTSQDVLKSGITAPLLAGIPSSTVMVGNDCLEFFSNT